RNSRSAAAGSRSFRSASVIGSAADSLRPAIDTQATDAAVGKNVESHVRDVAKRLHLILEAVPRMRLQRGLRDELAPGFPVSARVETARAGRVAFEVPRVDLDAPDRPGCAET